MSEQDVPKQGGISKKISASPRLGGEDLPSVADSLFATSRIYSLFQNISPENSQEAESDHTEEKTEFAYDQNSQEASIEDQAKREQRPKDLQDLRDLFNAWNSLDDEGEPDDISGSEAWTQAEVPEQALEAGEEAFAYDEWDRELNDYRVGWSRVIEKRVEQGDRGFVELACVRYRGVISSIWHQFQLMKPENLTKINRAAGCCSCRVSGTCRISKPPRRRCHRSSLSFGKGETEGRLVPERARFFASGQFRRRKTRAFSCVGAEQQRPSGV